MRVLLTDILPATQEVSKKASAHGLMFSKLILILFYKRP